MTFHNAEQWKECMYVGIRILETYKWNVCACVFRFVFFSFSLRILCERNEKKRSGKKFGNFDFLFIEEFLKYSYRNYATFFFYFSDMSRTVLCRTMQYKTHPLWFTTTHRYRRRHSLSTINGIIEVRKKSVHLCTKFEVNFIQLHITLWTKMVWHSSFAIVLLVIRCRASIECIYCNPKK